MKVEARLAVLTGEVRPPLLVVKAKNGEEWTAIGTFTSEWWADVFLGAVNSGLSGAELEDLNPSSPALDDQQSSR